MAAQTSSVAASWKDGFTSRVEVLAATSGNALDGVQVTYAWPAVETLPEGIYMGDETGQGIVDWRIEVISNNSGGPCRRMEFFSVPVTIQTYTAGTTASADSSRDSEQRAAAMWAAIEYMLSRDTTFSQLVHGYDSASVCVTVPHKSGYASRVSALITLNRELS